MASKCCSRRCISSCPSQALVAQSSSLGQALQHRLGCAVPWNHVDRPIHVQIGRRNCRGLHRPAVGCRCPRSAAPERGSSVAVMAPRGAPAQQPWPDAAVHGDVSPCHRARLGSPLAARARHRGGGWTAGDAWHRSRRSRCVLFIVDAVVADDDRLAAPGHRCQAPWGAHRQQAVQDPSSGSKLPGCASTRLLAEGSSLAISVVVALQLWSRCSITVQFGRCLAQLLSWRSKCSWAPMLGGDLLLDQASSRGCRRWGIMVRSGREPEARQITGGTGRLGGPVEGERSELSALVLAAHQQTRSQPMAQAEIADQGIPHQRHKGAAEQRRWSPSAALQRSR